MRQGVNSVAVVDQKVEVREHFRKFPGQGPVVYTNIGRGRVPPAIVRQRMIDGLHDEDSCFAHLIEPSR
jgi:hypothetical protein